jgi:hypothetical protein
MRVTRSLVVAGVIALSLGVLGSVALASSLAGSSPGSTGTTSEQRPVPGVYGSR